LNADQEDQQFVKPIKKFKQKHPWIKERPSSHKMPQVVPIIPREVQIHEAHRHTISLQ
jgi:hypothetical protein